MTKQRYRPPIEKKISKELKDGEVLVENDFVLFVEKDIIAVSRTCTHLGCRVKFIDKEKGFICPCHQSRFSWRGKYIEGPAKKDLKTFNVKRLQNGQGVIVYLPR